MRRVRRAGGRIAIGTWLSIEDIPFIRDLDEIARPQLGPFIDSRHTFGGCTALAALLSENGFQETTLETVSHDVRITDNGPLFARMNAMAVVGMRPKRKALDDAGGAQLASDITAASMAGTEALHKDGTLTSSLTTNVATARA